MRSTEGVAIQCDLTSQLAPFFDPHMILTLLGWLRTKNIHDPKDIDEARLEILQRSATIVPDIIEMYKLLNKIPPKSAETMTDELMASHARLEYNIRPLVTCVLCIMQKTSPDDPPERRSYKELTDWWAANKPTVDKLKEQGQNAGEIERILEATEFTEEHRDTAFAVAKSYYSSGDYASSVKYLKWCEYRLGEVLQDGLDVNFKRTCQWGLIAALIMQMSSKPPPSPSPEDGRDEADEEPNERKNQPIIEIAERLLRLDELLDESSGKVATFSSRDKVLLHRAWLLHWSLWPIFRYYLVKISYSGSMGREVALYDLLDWFLSERNICLVVLVCPHLLRYYSVCVILNRKRQEYFKSVISAISQVGIGRNVLDDPFTSLLEALFVNFDFDKAQHQLALCGKVAENDYFLEPLKAVVEENSRLIMFETYCRIHKSINIDMIAMKLNMSSETAERWIVNLIRHAKLEAKIDSERNRVEISSQTPNVYQQIVEKNQELASPFSTAGTEY